MSNNRWGDKQIILYAYSRTIFSNRKVWITGTSSTVNNVDEFQKDAAWKKPDTMRFSLYENLEKVIQIYSDRRRTQWCWGVGVGLEMDWENAKKEAFGE